MLTKEVVELARCRCQRLLVLDVGGMSCLLLVTHLDPAQPAEPDAPLVRAYHRT